MENRRRQQKPKGLGAGRKGEARRSRDRELSLFSRNWNEPPRTENELLEEILEAGNIAFAAHRVRANRGAAGPDGIKVEELDDYLSANWDRIKTALLNGTYKPQPVRRVEIPKPDGGKRLLGIPSVIDRVIQQAILQKLNPIFDPGFSELSFGFRPGRSAHDAVRKANGYVKSGYTWVVDIDLERFFDTIQHEVLMKRVGRKVKDKSVLKLIRLYLKSGIMLNGVCVRSEEGTPQGGPMSPLLANIMLDDLDKALEKRGHKFCRYADDCNVYVRSEKAGTRVKASMSRFIESALKLRVNESKSAVARPGMRKFLGFTIAWTGTRSRVHVSSRAVEKFKGKVREITRSRKGASMEDRLEEIRKYFTGWLQYFALSNNESTFQTLDGWVRRRLRMCQWVDWKRPSTRYRELVKRGLEENFAAGHAYSSKGKWRLARSLAMESVFGNRIWRQLGYYSLAYNYRRVRKCL